MNQLDSNQLITMCTLETSCGFPTQLQTIRRCEEKENNGERVGRRRKRGGEGEVFKGRGRELGKGKG